MFNNCFAWNLLFTHSSEYSYYLCSEVSSKIILNAATKENIIHIGFSVKVFHTSNLELYNYRKSDAAGRNIECGLSAEVRKTTLAPRSM